jgi:ubiquinone/menaquinone biosynthesis C-methylase UbiE
MSRLITVDYLPFMQDITLSQRLLAVFDALGIARAHIATQSPGDIAAFITDHPSRVSGVGVLAPPRVDPEPFTPLGHNLLYIAPAGGTLGRTARTISPRLPAAVMASLDDYAAESWDDIAADRPDVADRLIKHFLSISSDTNSASDTKPAPASAHTSGEVAGIRFRCLGSGPTLVLTPLSFAPSQWEPLLAILGQHFRVVSLSGPHLGMLALLEQRASLAGWQHMCAGIFDDLNLAPGNKVLEVGCGSGAVARQFAQHTAQRNPLTALDLSPYLLGEARLSANTAHLENAIAFVEGSADQLPFETSTFDAAYTVTVLEECNAKLAIAELIRVVKPGGRVAIVVRAIDLPQWWNMPLPPAIRSKIEMPASSISPNGIATAELYQLATTAGLRQLRLFPYTVASESIHGPIFEFPEAHALAQLTHDEQITYHAAKAQTVADGTIFMTRGHHCFIGEVPA